MRKALTALVAIAIVVAGCAKAPTPTREPTPWIPPSEYELDRIEVEIEREEQRIQELYEEYLSEECWKAVDECQEKCIDENCPDCEDRTFDAAHERAMDICYSHGEDEYSAVCYQDVFTEAYDTFYEVFCWACWDDCLEECYLPCP